MAAAVVSVLATAALNLTGKVTLRVAATCSNSHCWYMHPLRRFLYRLQKRGRPVAHTYVPTPQIQRRARRPRPLILIGGIFGLLWSKDEEEKVPVYIKYQLLKAQRAIRKDDFDSAEKAYHRALRRLATSQYASSQAYLEARAVTLDKLANMYLEQGRLEEAQVTFKEAMKFMLTAGMEKESEAMVEISLKLSKIYTNQKKYELAEFGFTWCVGTAEKLCEVSKTENILALWGMCLHGKGQYHLAVGQWDRAISSLSHSLELSKEVFNDSHLQVAVLHNDLATALDGSGAYRDAESHVRTSLEIMSGSHTTDADAEYLTRVYYNLGMVLHHQGKAAEAKVVLTKALDKAIKLRDKPLQRHIEHILGGL